MEKLQSSATLEATDFQEHPSQHYQQVEEDFDHEQHQRLRQAQRCLLQRKYDKTVAICSDYFQSFQQQNHNESLTKSQLQDETTIGSIGSVINLTCRIYRPYIENQEFDVYVDCREESNEPNEPTTLDQMIVIALQAIEEKDVQLQMKEASSLWNHRKHSCHSKQMWKSMIESLSHSSIGLEAFCVWLQFWQSQGLWKETLTWNVSVLCSRQSNEYFNSGGEAVDKQTLCQPSNMNPKDELWIECLAHQIPRILNPKLAADLMGHLEKVMWTSHKVPRETLNWDEMKEDINSCLLALTMTDQPQEKTIRLIQDSWVHDNYGVNKDGITNFTNVAAFEANGILSSTATKTIETAWITHLEAMLPPANQVHASDDCDVETEGRSMVPYKEDSSSDMPYRPAQNPKLWTWIDQLVSFVQDRVRETIHQMALARNHSNPHFRAQVVLSVAVTMLSWRQRKNLKVILSYILLPIRELLDALKAP